MVIVGIGLGIRVFGDTYFEAVILRAGGYPFSLVGHTITRSMELILCTGSSAMRKKISAVGRPPGQYVQPHYRGSFSPPPLIKGRGVANSLTARQAIWNQGGLVPYSAQFLLEFPLRLP